MLANRVRLNPYKHSPWDEARVLAGCLLALERDAADALPDPTPSPWARWWCSHSRALLSLRRMERPPLQALHDLRGAHPELPSLDGLLAACGVLFDEPVALTDPYWLAWVAIMNGTPAEGTDSVLDSVQALLGGVDYPDGVFQPLVLPLEEPVRIGVLIASGAGEANSAWETLLSRLSQPLPDLAGRLLGWSARRAVGIPNRHARLESALERLAGHPSRAEVWRHLPGIWSAI